MAQDRAGWWIETQRALLALTAAAVPFAWLGGATVHAQGFMRSPSINIESRMPSINPSIAPRVDPHIAGRSVVGIDKAGPRVNVTTSTMRTIPRIGVTSTLPYTRYSPNLYPACSYAYRDSDGECSDQPFSSTAGGGGATAAKGKNSGPRRNAVATVLERRTIANEIVAEIDGSEPDALARRHGLERIGSQNFPLIGSTIGLFRIIDGRSFDVVSREFAADAGVRFVQPNLPYRLQDQKQELKAALTEGDPAQYALAKLRLPEAHRLARGDGVRIAVIDSGIDARHPELANAVVDSFDALDSKEGPHIHGTGIAGAIVAHGRLMGSAPAAKILAIRAFGGAAGGAESSSYIILKALNHAFEQHAQIVNMSFAGPKDALIERGVAAAAANGMVMVAASGNAGAKSPPLYPAANPNVIAVSATDAQDRLFAASNRGSHIAVAAPGADIFLPAPDEKYQMTSGTSFSAAYVSGLVALMLQRNPALKPDEVRAILMETARDLGAPGRDDQFGAGEADAFAAVTAVMAAPEVPVAAVSAPPAAAKTDGSNDIAVTRALAQPAAAMASDKSAIAGSNRPAAQ